MPDIADVLKTAISSRLAQYEKTGFDTSQLATALGANQSTSGIFGNVKPEQLLGLLPEDVDAIANVRSTALHQQMLTDLGALDFVNKVTGKTEVDKSTSNLIEQTALAREQARTGKWQMDPVRVFIGNALEKSRRGDKMSKAEWAIVNKTAGGMSAEDASGVIQQIPMLMKIYEKDPDSLKNTMSLLKSATKVIEDTSFEPTKKEPEAKKRTPEIQKKFDILRANPKNKKYTDEELDAALAGM